MKIKRSYLIVLIMFMFLLGCNINTTEDSKAKFVMSNLDVSIISTKIVNTDSAKITIEYSVDCKYENCVGYIEFYGISLPFNFSQGAAIDGMLIKGLNYNKMETWGGSANISLKYIDVPKKHIFKIKMIGKLYLIENGKYEYLKEFSETLEKEVEIIKTN